MKLALLFLLTVVSAALLFSPQNANALGLRLAPLQYKTTLGEKERKTGFIDVSNPSSQAVQVRTSVQAFRQVNDDGGLQFYGDKQIQLGITTDLTTFDIGPREAVRMFFSMDGKNLPQGDVFAAIFFTTEPKQPRNGVGQLVRVGTILSIVNKTPGSRKAEISGLKIPFFQLSETIKGTYKIKNTGPKDTGFYPSVTISAWPGGKLQKTESALVFGGRERTNDLAYPAGLGVKRVDVAYGDSKKSQWVLTLAPWMLVLFLLLFLIVGIEVLLFKRRRNVRRKNKPSTS